MSQEIKTASEFILNAPLYALVACDMSPASEDELLSLVFAPLKFDGHCASCKQRTTYKRSDYEYVRFISGNRGLTPAQLPSKGFTSTTVHCARNDDHQIRVWFYATKAGFVKVGQYPSLADIANDEARVFDKALSKLDRTELHRAIGLAAHGIGVGSFVYLRRVFERLLLRTFENHAAENNWSQKDWTEKRVKERIALLGKYLPDFVHECEPLYGILSKGLHELDEEECSISFPVLKSAIIEILEDEQRAKEKELKRGETKAHLERLSSAIKTKSTGE